MFAKLRRAKTFINRTKHEEEELKQTSLDLSETAHLRRNVPINNEVLERQKRLNRSQEKLNNHRSRKLQRQVSRSHEHLHDQVLEQLRKLNFGDSYSKKDARILSETREISQEFQRLHPAYFSERNFRRKSLGVEDTAQKIGIGHHRTSGDVISNFGTKKATQKSPSGSDDDFLLNRKSVDMNHNFNRRNPAYVSERSALSKTGFRSFLQKIKGTQRSNESVVACDTGYSTASSGASFVYEDAHSQIHKGARNHHYNNTGSCSNSSTASSSASVGFDRSHHSERLISYNSKRDIVVNEIPQLHKIERKFDEEHSRKRQHYQTKPSRAPGRNISGDNEERRHKILNRRKREDCLVDNR